MVLLMETVANEVSDIVSLGIWSMYPLMQDLSTRPPEERGRV